MWFFGGINFCSNQIDIRSIVPFGFYPFKIQQCFIFIFHVFFINLYYNSYYQYQKFTYMMFFSTLVKQVLNTSIFIYFWTNRIKNVLKLNLNSVKKNKNILRTSEAENCYFLRTLNLGLKNVVLIKKRV